MFTFWRNHQEFEMFAEKRLIYNGPKKSPKSTPSDADIAKGTADLLGMLRGDVEHKKAEEKAPTYHTDKRKTTRPLKAPKPRHTKSVEIAKKAVKLKGVMDPIEVKRMQGTHEKIYEHYINPAFIAYVEQMGKPEGQKKSNADKIFAALDIAMNNPYGLEYRSAGTNRVEVVKRSPYTDANKDVPNDFRIVLERKGYITHVAGINLKTAEDEVPWVDSEQYTKQMRDYRERWTAEHVRYLYGDSYKQWIAKGRPEGEWPKIFKNSFEPISEDMKRLHVLHNIGFPKRFVAMVKARGLQFELNDPRFKDIELHQAKQGKTYKEITEEGYGPDGKLQIMVVADPELDGVYQIWTRGNFEDPVRVNKEGYMLTQDTDGQWKPDPRYVQSVRYGYYAQNKDAMDNLDAKEKAEVEQGAKNAEKQAQAREKAKEAREKRKKVDEKIDKADINKLKEVAITVWPQYKDAIENKKEGDEAFMRKTIKDLLDKDPSKIDAVYKEFGIEAEKEKPAEAPKQEEKKEEVAEKTKEQLIKALDELKDAAKVKIIYDALRPDGEPAEESMEKQKEQLKKWLDEGKLTLKALQENLAEALK